MREGFAHKMRGDRGGPVGEDYVMQVVIVMYFGWKFETDVRESFRHIHTHTQKKTQTRS